MSTQIKLLVHLVDPGTGPTSSGRVYVKRVKWDMVPHKGDHILLAGGPNGQIESVHEVWWDATRDQVYIHIGNGINRGRIVNHDGLEQALVDTGWSRHSDEGTS